ncbi:MAG: adenylyltransferase/cytidyltransferase family protein [DPANN group archaeon]|nr:adenylyltransferase/cytidyltransferase family protein [DPANN group archaeon]
MGRQVSGRAGMIARFKPVHLGHASILEAMCEQASEVIIGLGSSNVCDLRNPFTAKESAEMIGLVLKKRFSNYAFVEIPDLNNGQKWRGLAVSLFGKLDYFVTANDYVRELLKDDYKIIHPLEIIPEDRRVPVDGTLVRITMAKGGEWERLVPAEVSKYIKENKMEERFCAEYGLATLARNAERLLEATA